MLPRGPATANVGAVRRLLYQSGLLLHVGFINLFLLLPLDLRLSATYSLGDVHTSSGGIWPLITFEK